VTTTNGRKQIPRDGAAKFFDRFAASFDTIYDGKRSAVMQRVDRYFRSDMFVRFALTFEALGDLSGKTVLDIGCGSGPYVVEALSRRAAIVTAVDPAANMLALVRERLEGRSFAGRCSLVQAAFPADNLEAHDHVVVMGVMDYISDAATFLANLKSVTKLSAAVSFPSSHWMRTPIRKLRYRLRRCPVYFYDREQIERLATIAGFRTIEIRKIPGAGMDYHVCLKP